jgi:SlyX protein
MDEKRCIDIETKISHQEHLIEELNQVIYNQQQAIDQLEAKLNILARRFQKAVEGPGDIGPADQKPPHY